MAIKSSDPEAIEKLEQKIQKLEDQRNRNNVINKLVRKNDRQGLKDIGLDEAQVNKILTPDFANRIGIPSYVNQNIAGNIRTAKARITDLKKVQETIGNDEETIAGIRIYRDRTDDRLRLFFPDKPEEEIRAALKRRGFKWSPRAGAWQRQLTANAETSLRYFLQENYPDEQLEKVTVPVVSKVIPEDIKEAMLPVDHPLMILDQDSPQWKSAYEDWKNQPAPEQDLWEANIFELHPEKVLGEAYQASGRFGQVTKFKGDISDLNKIVIPTDWKESQDPDSVTISTIGAEPSKDVPLTPEQEENISNAISASRETVTRKTVRKLARKIAPTDPSMPGSVLSFGQTLNTYNPEISETELDVFIWHKWNIGQPLGGKWKEILDPSTISQDQIDQWTKDLHLCYHNGELLPAYIYFAENIYDRQETLQEDSQHIIFKYGQATFSRQERRLGEIYQDLINNRLRLSIDENNPNRLMISPVSDFAYNFRIATLNDEKPIRIKASGRKKDFGQPDFKMDIGKNDYQRTAFTDLPLIEAFVYWMKSQEGTIRFMGGTNWLEILDVYIRQRSRPQNIDPTVWARKRAKTKAEAERLFNVFLATALLSKDKEKIEMLWNKRYNSFKQINYNKVPVAFSVGSHYPGDNPMEIRPEKRDAVAFAFSEGSACLAYEVGVGKTWAAIFTIAQFMDAGYCGRPFIVVPNQTYKQWISEIRGILPHVKINDLYNLSSSYREELMGLDGKVSPVEEGSISIMTYEGFENIGFSEDTRNKTISQFYDILNQGGADGMQKSAKKEASFHERLEEIVGKGIGGTMVDIEDLGFDYALWDEAHAMKKVFTSVKSISKGDSQKKFKNYEIQSGTPSVTALKGFMISQYIARHNNERNVLLLTATPFTNSPLEVFSILALIAYDKLRESSLNNLNSFFDNYIQVSQELVINAALRPVRKQVFKGFNNLQSLQKLIFRFIDHKSAVNIIRPDKYVIPYKGKMIDGVFVPASTEETVDSIIPLDPGQALMMEEIRSYVEGMVDLTSLCSVSSTEEDEENESIDNQTEGEVLSEQSLDSDEKDGVRILRGISYARNLALSPYLYQCSGLGEPTYKEYIETSPKFRYTMGCIKSVRDYHIKEGTPMSGQVIYMNRGVEWFDKIKEYLVKELNFNSNEVGIISAKMKTPKGVKKKDAKQDVQDKFLGRKFNQGTGQYVDIPDEDRIKILIGSSSIREGINLQKHSTVLYNLWIDWNPTDVVQLEGRIWRQGNLFKSVRVVNPLLENSMDAFIFQKLEEKTDNINAIFNKDGKTNVLRVEEFSPKELKESLIRDPRALAEMRVDEEKEKVNDDKADIDNNIKIATSIKSILSNFEYYEKQIREFLERFRPTAAGQTRSVGTVISLVGKTVKEQKDAEGRSFKDEDVQRMYNVSPQGLSAPYWYAEFKTNYRILERQKQDFLDPKMILPTVDGVQLYIDDQKKSVEKIDELVNAFSSEENIRDLIEKIIKEREAQKYTPATVNERVQEFKRLNKLLSQRIEQKEFKEKEDIIPAGCPPMEGDEYLTDPESIKLLEKCLEIAPETKAMHTDKYGNYTPSRIRLHNQIKAKYTENKQCVKREKPIAILTGGVPGSGKSTFLKKFVPFMDSDKILRIDADEIRAELPEYKGWNASATHIETSDIYRDLINNIGEPCTYDVLYDGTMNKAKNYIPLVRQLKSLGYEVFVLFVSVPKEVSTERVLARYKKMGRYVPLAVVNAANKAGTAAFDKVKKLVDGYILIDGVTSEILETKGKEIPTDREYLNGKPPTKKPDLSAEAARARIRIKIKLAKAK